MARASRTGWLRLVAGVEIKIKRRTVKGRLTHRSRLPSPRPAAPPWLQVTQNVFCLQSLADDRGVVAAPCCAVPPRELSSSARAMRCPVLTYLRMPFFPALCLRE